MVEVQLIARDAMGRMVAFTMGMGRNAAAACAAATVGMTARLAADVRLSGLVCSYAVEVL